MIGDAGIPVECIECNRWRIAMLVIWCVIDGN